MSPESTEKYSGKLRHICSAWKRSFFFIASVPGTSEELRSNVRSAALPSCDRTCDDAIRSGFVGSFLRSTRGRQSLE